MGRLAGEDPREAEAASRFGLFSLLLAVSLLLHQLWWGGFEVSSFHFVVVLAALWTVLRPGSVPRLLILLAAEVVSVALDMPGVGSHTLLVLVSGACVLAFVAATALRTRRLPEAGALFEGIAPFLRVALLVVYVAAGIAKLNTGFFDAEISCAASLSAKVAWFDPSLLDGAWRIAPAVWGTVLIELALPVLLAVPRTRLAGLGLGVAFHAVLALAGNVPFSALALAFYVAFLPAGAAGRVLALSGRSAALPVLVGGWIAAAVAFSSAPEAGRDLIANGTRLAVLLLAVGGAVLLVRARSDRPTGSERLGHPVLVAGIVVLVANAMSPYLGFKTESSFTMFSNLQTEPGYWNHAVIPEAVRIFDYQDQLVAITGSNDPTLRRRSRGGTRLVRYELERYLRARPGARVTRSGGRPTTTSVATPLLDKVAKFRDVRPPERPGC